MNGFYSLLQYKDSYIYLEIKNMVISGVFKYLYAWIVKLIEGHATDPHVSEVTLSNSFLLYSFAAS